MKKLLFTGLLFVCAIGSAQIKVVEQVETEKIGKIAPGGIKTIECEKIGDYYSFHFRDAKYKQIEEWEHFVVKDVDNGFEQLYSLIQKGFEDMPKEDIEVETGESKIWLNYEKFLGVKVFRFFVKNKAGNMSASNQYTKKQVDKLFGKNKK